MTPYNQHQNLLRADAAGRQFLLDPGSGGTVKVAPNADCVLLMATTGARTLQAAAQLPVGTRLLALATTTGVTVNSYGVGIGEFAEFRVTLTSANANQWTLVNASALAAQLGDQNLSIPLSQFRTWDAMQTALPGTAANDDLGLVTGTWLTDAPILRTIVNSGTSTVRAGLLFPVPLDYQNADPTVVRVPYTTVVAPTSTATLDLEIVRVVAPTVDIVSTNANDVAAVNAADAVFVLNPANLVAGEMLFARVSIASVSAFALTDIQIRDFKLLYTS